MAIPKALTVKSNNGRLRELKTSCGVCIAHNPIPNQPHPIVHNFTALWDTGATGTVITEAVVKKLGLAPITQTKVYHADGEATVNVYAVNILLPNNVGFSFVRVTEGKLTGMDVLIGMDIITNGDFSVTNVNGKTVFSFRSPSTKEIDYVQESNTQREKENTKPKHPNPTNFTPPKKKRNK